MQLQHYNTDFISQNHNIFLLCDSVSSPANIGNLFRISDSFGIRKIVFGGVEVDLKSPRLKRTARATQKWVATEDNVDLLVYISELKKADYVVIALEITDTSKAIQEFDFSNTSKKIALVIGDENLGVSETILEQCDQQLHIAMFGKNSSMNVSQAAAIALYEITKQLQQN